MDVMALFRERGIQPSAQRIAVAEFVLHTDRHPSADQVWQAVKARLPVVSRATVYNTLNLLVAEGLLQQLVLAEGRVVFDAKIDPHHHFIDELTGRIEDVAWEAVKVEGVDALPGLDVHDYQVVMRGRRKKRRR